MLLCILNMQWLFNFLSLQSKHIQNACKISCILYIIFPLKFNLFGCVDERLFYESPLRARKGKTWNGKLVYVIIGSRVNWDNPADILDNVYDYNWLRPVYGGDVYGTNQVAFACYTCHDKFFFHHTSGFAFPSTCPLGHPNYIDYSSRNTP